MNYLIIGLIVIYLCYNLKKCKENFNQYNQNNKFMIFYINLKKRLDRKKKIELELKKLSEIKKYKIEHLRIDAESEYGAYRLWKITCKSFRKSKK